MDLKKAETKKDRDRVDAYIAAHPLATPYHLTAWLSAVEAAYGLAGETFFSLQDGEIAGVVSRVLMPRLLGGKSYCALPYCDVGGVLADNAELGDQIWTALHSLDNSDAVHARRETASLPLDVDALKVQEETKQGVKARLVLPLLANSDDMLASFKSKLRSQIRKSDKNGVQCEVSTDVEGFFGVMQKNMHRLGSPCHSRAWFEQILESYADNARLFIATFEGQIVGGSITLRCGSKVAVPWASTLSEYNRLSPNMLMYWTMLSTAINDGAECFDFGRSTIGEGTYRFKRQWGAEVYPLMWRDYRGGEVLPASTSSRSGLGEAVVKTWTKLPPWLVNRLGPVVRPYISL